ncbi:SDR family oxidoreductase [Peribacillus simplex]|uniref:SDR family oxidoreductase n=1 Tax=Peribacillus simplex TaxID=1478 RepID=UPI003D2D67BF
MVFPKSFKNHYERTKLEAELLVEELKNEIPFTRIRPGSVKGHSKTGEKVVNLVPIDYIIQATASLALYNVGQGKPII